jgi:hypothetical protein
MSRSPVRGSDEIATVSPVNDGPKHATPDDEMPARPPRWGDVPSPLDDVPEPMPTSVVVSVWLWITSAVVAAATLIYAVFRLDERQAAFEADVLAREPDISTSNLDGVVTILTAASIGGLALPAILQVVLAIAMSRGRNGARIALGVVGILSLPAVLIAGGTLAGPGSMLTNYVELGTIVMLAVMVAALVAMFLPSANGWFREQRRR